MFSIVFENSFSTEMQWRNCTVMQVYRYGVSGVFSLVPKKACEIWFIHICPGPIKPKHGSSIVLLYVDLKTAYKYLPFQRSSFKKKSLRVIFLLAILLTLQNFIWPNALSNSTQIYLRLSHTKCIKAISFDNKTSWSQTCSLR